MSALVAFYSDNKSKSSVKGQAANVETTVDVGALSWKASEIIFARSLLRFSNISYQVDPRDFEVSKDPAEWEFVERLLPPDLVPRIPDLKEYPSGFRPARLSPGELLVQLGAIRCKHNVKYLYRKKDRLICFRKTLF